MRLTNSLLAVFALSLLAIIFFSSRDAELPEQPVIFSPGLDNYQVIEIRRQGEPTLICRREQGRWGIQHTAESTLILQANLWKLKQIIDNLSKTNYLSIEGELEYSQFDLQQPLVMLKLDNREIGFGNTNPINRKRYISIDDKVYLIKDDVYRHVIDDWYEFVSKSLFDENKKITYIAINNMKAVRSKDSHWALQATNHKPGKDQIQTFIDAWQNTQAALVTTAEKRDFNFAIDISFEDGDTRHYIATNEHDTLIVFDQRSKLEYHFSTTSTKQLLQFQ